MKTLLIIITLCTTNLLFGQKPSTNGKLNLINDKPIKLDSSIADTFPNGNVYRRYFEKKSAKISPHKKNYENNNRNSIRIYNPTKDTSYTKYYIPNASHFFGK
jgi:hypothetical protein